MYHDALGYCGYRWSRLDLKAEIAETDRFMHGEGVTDARRQWLRNYQRSLRVRLAVLYLTDRDRE